MIVTVGIVFKGFILGRLYFRGLFLGRLYLYISFTLFTGGKDKDKKGGDKDKAKGAESKRKPRSNDQNMAALYLSIKLMVTLVLLVFVEEKTMDEFPVPENPEVVVFATYWSTPKYPVKVSVLGEMADASEKLRQNGLSHIYPHPVCISQTRSCPLEPPPPPEKIPAWKLIRPKKKKPAPSDEPVCKYIYIISCYLLGL